MEDVLELYAEPFDRERPVVGFDERPLQLVAETRNANTCRAWSTAADGLRVPPKRHLQPVYHG